MGFDFNRFVDLSKREAKHLICSICLNIYDNAINSECGHTFCKQCLQKWIQENHSLCPECRKEFTRKRSIELSNNDIFVFISSLVFSRNLKINSMINELNIKCDYHFNGCQQSVELGLLSSHLKNCEHRYCEKCDFTAGRPEEHNCIQLLKSDRNEWKRKFNEIKDQKSKLEDEIQRNRSDLNRWKSMYEKSEQINKELSEKVSKLKELIERNENELKVNETKLKHEIDFKKDFILSLADNSEHTTDYVRFGTYAIAFCTLGLRPNRIYFKSAGQSQFFLPTAYIEELMFCLDPTLPVIVIKADSFSGKAIRNNIHLTNPMTGWFDVESRDPSHRYILIRFSRSSHDFFMVVLYLFRCRPKVLQTMDAIKTRQMLGLSGIQF